MHAIAPSWPCAVECVQASIGSCSICDPVAVFFSLPARHVSVYSADTAVMVRLPVKRVVLLFGIRKHAVPTCTHRWRDVRVCLGEVSESRGASWTNVHKKSSQQAALRVLYAEYQVSGNITKMFVAAAAGRFFFTTAEARVARGRFGFWCAGEGCAPLLMENDVDRRPAKQHHCSVRAAAAAAGEKCREMTRDASCCGTL